MMQIMCVIKHKEQPGTYWQTRTGWVDAKDATQFTMNDTHKYPLPPNGEWIRLDEPSPMKRIA